MSSSEKIYTIEMLAEVLGLALDTLRKKLRKGEIKAYKRSGRWYVLHSHLVEYIQEGQFNLDLIEQEKKQKPKPDEGKK